MTVRTHQETLGFQTEVKQILQLVVNSLYSNREIFLRELVSNASDAADRLRFEAISDASLYGDDPVLRVRVTFNEKDKTITIDDNGVGMSREEVINHLGTIAKSGTKEFLGKLSGDQKKDSHLIGQFGVGFYAAFIVADKVTVKTRRAGLPKGEGVLWESDGTGEYTIANIVKETRGTEIILHLKDDQAEFLNDYRLRNVIKRYSDHINLPVDMKKSVDQEAKSDNKEDKEVEKEIAAPEWEQVNCGTALWTLNKNSITDEQYKELYHQVSHDFSDPLIWAHHRIEGKLDYTSVLFVPAKAPFDLWQRENTHGLKLYVQRVFIMDKADQFLPNYLRFVRGVLDTNSLPLNISREILQENPVISKLRAAMVKRVLDILTNLAEKDVDKYATFWSEFGAVLKEGPAEDFAQRERIAKLLRFSSTHTDTAVQNVSFADYVARMRPGQDKIYYITAENFMTAKSSPHLEIFRKKQIEVLLLHDRVDEWLVSHLSEFEKYGLQSVAKGDIDLTKVGIVDSSSDTKKETEVRAELKPMLERVKNILGDKVKEVRFSHRLTESPACLVVSDNDMGIQLQRILKAAGQSAPEVKPILELNSDHLLVTRMSNIEDDTKFAEWVGVLFDQALLVEGAQLTDPVRFVQRMNRLLLEDSK